MIGHYKAIHENPFPSGNILVFINDFVLAE